MKNSHILLAAAILYLIILVVGGSAYYAYTIHHQKVQAQIELTQKQQKEQAAKKQQLAQQVVESAPKSLDDLKEEQLAALKSNMKEETINGITYYRHEWPKKLPSGVYLRPFVAVGNGKCILKNDVYYFYSISDPQQTAWIFGDQLDIYAGGKITTITFDKQRLRKHMASDAEWLVENYVVNADEATIAAFKRIAADNTAHIVYYQTGGKARRHDLRPQERERIREMVTLYELLNAE